MEEKGKHAFQTQIQRALGRIKERRKSEVGEERETKGLDQAYKFSKRISLFGQKAKAKRTRFAFAPCGEPQVRFASLSLFETKSESEFKAKANLKRKRI